MSANNGVVSPKAAPITPNATVPPASTQQPLATSESSTTLATSEPSTTLATSKQSTTARQTFAELEPESQLSDFDQAISEQVTVMRETLRSQTTSPADDNDSHAEHLIASRHSSVSPAIDIIRGRSPSDLELRPKPENSYPFAEPEAGPSRESTSFLARRIAQIEAERSMEAVDILGQHSDSGTSSSASDTKFEEENQLTVIPAKKSTPPGGSRLQDLFKPINEENARKSLSYEVVEERSGNEVQPTKSHSGEIDVFKHLFDDDDDAQGGSS